MLKVVENALIEIQTLDEENPLQEFELEQPNGSNSFRFEFVEVPVRSQYRDKNMVLRKGKNRYELQFIYDYETHEMRLFDLLTAINIRLKYPPHYNEIPVKLVNEEAVRDWYEGHVVGSDEEGNADPMPAGPVTLEFVSKNTFTPAEVMEFEWHKLPEAES